jgi:adenine-specific DNA-methyltransferase
MVTAEDANKKALHELILYYLGERNADNNELKQLIITNVNEWYIIDANFFDKYIYRNTKIEKDYKIYINDKKDNPWFYDVIKTHLSELNLEIPCVHFNIKDYDTILRNNNKEDDKELNALLKILSPQHLLKIATPNDSNALDDKFYKELLHIIGLEEAKDGGKNIIRRKKEKRNPASLLEATIEAIHTEEVLHRIPDQSIYGTKKEERTFNVALELCITWINRILFLKLLEGQLINYHAGNKDFRFLNSETINDFDELFKLFHKVLAVNLSERNETIQIKYSKVPYLNSSLFEISELEDQTIKINALDNSGKLELIGSTVLKELKSKVNSLSTLEYLFLFLDAYDFASDGSDEVQEDNKTIINASVLGTVFEKINGYKDGSIYTPGFITMNMCRKAIRLAVIQRFKDKYNWNIEQFEDIQNYLADRKSAKDILEFNELINSLRLCDPAVGSGHFLVSSLNEIIVIKYELGLLADKAGKRINDYEFEIVADEIIITDLSGNIVEYKLRDGKPNTKEMQRLQKTLFHEKQTIIENCLFGVDINPNSVKICRLRLWIELLKNAYYKEETNYVELETLPNIDINIKCGNSLLSRFALNDDISEALKIIKYDVTSYRNFVNKYKNEKSREVKRELEDIIRTIKTGFKTEIKDKDAKKLKNYMDALKELTQGRLFVTAKEKKENEDLQKKLEASIRKSMQDIEEIKANAIYKNSFEWRFEFPEVLSDSGDFVGFDVVVGNPPYINAMDLKKTLPDALYKTLKLNYKTAKGTVDLFIYFFEAGLKLLKSNGHLNYITPNRYLSASYGEALREFLFHEVRINEIIDFSHVKVFKEASTYPVVTSLTLIKTNSQAYSLSIGKYDEGNASIKFKTESSEKLNFIEGYIWGYLLNDKMDITEKVISNSVSITNCATINATSTASEADAYHDLINETNGYKLINTGTIDRYESRWGKEPLTDKGKKYMTPYLPINDSRISVNRNNLYKQPKIILAKIAISTEAFFDSRGEFASINTNCFHSFNSEYDPKYILAWLNSKLFQYTFECFFEGLKMQGGYLLYSAPNIEKMFIKPISLQEQVPFIDLVNKVTLAREEGKDSKNYEDEIDTLFYKLYGITKSEKIIIEGK